MDIRVEHHVKGCVGVSIALGAIVGGGGCRAGGRGSGGMR